MNTALLLGAYGLLGRYVDAELGAAGFRVARQSRASHEGAVTFDPGEPAALAAQLAAIRPDVIVNTIALTNVDYCETHVNEAYRINTRVAETLADWVREHRAGCHVIQISTDQLYAQPGPQAEAAVDLLNVYSLTKYAAEIALRSVPSHTVLRTNFYGRSRTPGRASFSDWIHRALLEETPIRLAVDIQFNPLSLPTLARYIAAVATRRTPGVFNVGARGSLSKHGFGLLLARELSLATRCVGACSAAELAFRVPRPLDMRMDVSRFEAEYGPMPELEADLARTALAYTGAT
ncbi:MAG TPA: sugar nucleotide-binding protein [Steroidobacteraceae bacterium]|nr:sugar nucleotide-binding protein [Steroidobacteraceae bacterium]